MTINWVHIYKLYKGLWVALADDEKTVISSGKRAKDTLNKAQKNGYPNPILTKIPTRIKPIAG